MAALTMAATAQQEPQYISSFKYDKRVHDFGTIKEKDGKVSHTFTATSTRGVDVPPPNIPRPPSCPARPPR